MSGAMEERVSTPDYAPPARLIPALRAAHAGEAACASLCRGILAVAGDAAAIDAARRQRRAAEEHLAVLETMLPHRARSRLLPLCRGAAWLAGAASGNSAAAARAAVAAVLDRRYREAAATLHGEDAALGALLEHCREEAAACGRPGADAVPGPRARLIGGGIAFATMLARLL
jgi:demethoxyubiquinone hydroxylase (CLK1/Coq7/Cat5 family)